MIPPPVVAADWADWADTLSAIGNRVEREGGATPAAMRALLRAIRVVRDFCRSRESGERADRLECERRGTHPGRGGAQS